jgi:hypothetical protein
MDYTRPCAPQFASLCGALGRDPFKVLLKRRLPGVTCRIPFLQLRADPLCCYAAVHLDVCVRVKSGAVAAKQELDGSALGVISLRARLVEVC